MRSGFSAPVTVMCTTCVPEMFGSGSLTLPSFSKAASTTYLPSGTPAMLKAPVRLGAVPGDGAHVIYPMVMGINRARYFLLTSEVINAKQALEMGMINEILPKDKLMDDP